ncbi:MAG: hypothetical protein MUC35_03485 [Candidatus Margulisbacteria bacterium]|jgi:hypothetical protein|nr:hypothetical protein [Candidatus Margulisiibacteriota bacterium]
MDHPPPSLAQTLENYRSLFTRLRASCQPTRQKALVLIAVSAALCGWWLIGGLLAGQQAEPDWNDLTDARLQRSIAAGVRARRLFIDDHYGAEPGDLQIFKKLGLKPYISRHDLTDSQEELFRSGALLLNYALGKPPFTPRDRQIVRRYLANGGRALLLFPAWVWETYDRQPLARAPYSQIAGDFGLTFTPHPVARPADPSAAVFDGEFSGVKFRAGTARTILAGSDGTPVAVTVQRDGSRLIVWGQNNLFTAAGSAPGKELLRRLFSWLYQGVLE